MDLFFYLKTIRNHAYSEQYIALEPGMWKRKLQVFVEAEAGSGKRVPLALPLWLFISNVKNLNVMQFFVKYTTKVNV